MKRRKPKATRAQKTGAAEKMPARKPMSRRDVIANLKLAAVAIAVVGGGGWYIVSDVQAGIHEHDLSRLGNGIPTVVQIHDPQCPSCLELQRETRAALERFDDGEIQYLVANIRMPEGRGLAAAHGVQHVTLLMFDGAGKRRDMLHGNYTRDAIEAALRAHLRRVSGG